MNRKDLFLRAVISLALLCSAAAITRAQDPQTDTPPKPPAKTYGPIGVEDQNQDQNQTQETLQPDNRPLTGFQELTLGTQMERHSYWVPGVAYYNFIQSSDQFQGGSNSWSSTNYLAGNMTLMENWSRSQLLVNYSGGGYISTDSAGQNGWFQQLGASQTFNWQRWQLTLLDQFEYLPETQFGFGVGSALSLPGIGGSLGGNIAGFTPGVAPGESIFAAIGPRYFNTGGVQATYQISRRSSITVGGMVSILRFSDAGNIESNTYLGNVGYNYQLTKNDTIGLEYRITSYHFLNDPQAIGDQLVQVAYGKRITGRLALQLSAGPEITTLRVAQAPSTKTQYIAASGSAAVTYGFERGVLSLNYFHGVTAGSGVFLGATTDQVTGRFSRNLTRVWTGELHGGYSRNGAVQSTPGTPSFAFNTVFGGASVARPLGRNASLTLGYTAYDESGSSSASFLVHQFSLGLSWHTRPFVLR